MPKAPFPGSSPGIRKDNQAHEEVGLAQTIGEYIILTLVLVGIVYLVIWAMRRR